MTDKNLTEVNTTKHRWPRVIAKFGRSNVRRASWQIFNTLVPYFLLWTLMIFLVQRQFPYWITLAFAVIAGGFLVRIFIVFHDCCHGSFLPSRRANFLLGYLTGILTFTAFEDWRHVHNRHHATAGDLDRRGVGDIWTMTTDEYLKAPQKERLVYRFYRNPFIFLGSGSLIAFLLLNRFPNKESGLRGRMSVFRTNIAIALIVALSINTIGLPAYLLIQLPIIMVAGTIGLWLFYIQHQFETAYWVRHDSWDPMRVALEGSSYFKLPKILQWFTGNIGFHHIHHVSSSIPNYHLQQCYDSVPAFQMVRPITLKSSLRLLNLSLCDEKEQKLVSFRSVQL